MSAPTVVHVTLEKCASGFMILGEVGEAMSSKLIRVSTKLVPLLDSIQSGCLGYHAHQFVGGKRRAKVAAEDAQICCRALVEGISVMFNSRVRGRSTFEGWICPACVRKAYSERCREMVGAREMSKDVNLAQCR